MCVMLRSVVEACEVIPVTQTATASSLAVVSMLQGERQFLHLIMGAASLYLGAFKHTEDSFQTISRFQESKI
eukprot:2116372-Amphidinium_carterae.1